MAVWAVVPSPRPSGGYGLAGRDQDTSDATCSWFDV